MRVNAFCAIGVFFFHWKQMLLWILRIPPHNFLYHSHAIRIDLFGFLWNFY